MPNLFPFRQQFPNCQLIIAFIQAHIRRILVRYISSLNRYCQWDTMSFCQNTALAATLTTVSGIRPGFFHSMALWSWLHPWIAMSSLISSIHRISPDPLAKCDETHLLSTDNQCLVCRIWHPLLSGCSSVNDHLWVWPSLPKAHLVSWNLLKSKWCKVSIYLRISSWFLVAFIFSFGQVNNG